MRKNEGEGRGKDQQQALNGSQGEQAHASGFLSELWR